MNKDILLGQMFNYTHPLYFISTVKSLILGEYLVPQFCCFVSKTRIKNREHHFLL